MRVLSRLATIVLVLRPIGCDAAGSNADPLAFHRLSNSQRKTIDDKARKSTPVKVVREKTISYDNLVSWLSATTTLPPEEEFRLASEAAREMTAELPVVETPPIAAQVFAKLVDQLPMRMRPEAFPFSLTVVDSDEL